MVPLKNLIEINFQRIQKTPFLKYRDGVFILLIEHINGFVKQTACRLF